MYGVVGQVSGFWDQEIEDITAMAVINALNELSAKNDIIQFRINSPGGSIFEGEAIVNAIQNSSAEVHTYNDGVAASMASTIWLAGHKRFMGRNATLMIHAPMNFVFGNAVEMREMADVLDKFTEASAESIAALTDLSAEDAQSRFFQDGKDHWMSFQRRRATRFSSPKGPNMKLLKRPPRHHSNSATPELLQPIPGEAPRRGGRAYFRAGKRPPLLRPLPPSRARKPPPNKIPSP